MAEEAANVNVTSALPDDIRESVAVSNLKTLGEALSASITLSVQNAVSHQQRVNAIAEGALQAWTKNMSEVDPIQAVSTLKTLTGNDLAQQLAQLSAAIAQIQQGIKGAQTTPPPTA